MTTTQATRPIRKGSWWTNGEHDVQVTSVTKKDVYYTCADAVGVCEVWHFRENFAPGKKGGRTITAPREPRK